MLALIHSSKFRQVDSLSTWLQYATFQTLSQKFIIFCAQQWPVLEVSCLAQQLPGCLEVSALSDLTHHGPSPLLPKLEFI